VALFHHLDLRVLWSDTDPAGIVWFGVFFRYFEHAEEDLYRRLGSDRTALLRRLHIFMPRTSLQSGFRSPAKLGDAISVGVGIAEITERRIGFAFDIGHATLEGGLSWPIQVQLAAPRFGVVYVKDFHWEKKDGRWEPEWCALGDGMVDPAFFRMLTQAGYKGPICQHNEYDMGKTPAEHLRHFKADLKMLRGWLAGA